MTPEALADFRAQLPQCELAVYADIRSGTVLLTDGALRYPQEYLDALSECAAQLFAEAPAFDDHVIDPVLIFGPTGGRAFFCSSVDPSEALCCLFGTGADITKLLAAGRALVSPAAT
ncbi:MAG: hypothetical protein AAF689_14645 [Pseudomonadota bacterium]